MSAQKISLNIDNKTLSVPDKGSLRTAHKAVTLERIIQAAKKSFIQSGYRGASLQQIANLAGTTTTTFYRYFNSKSDLIWIIRDELRKKVHSAVQQLIESHEPDLLTIRNWLNDYHELWESFHALSDAYWEATLIDDNLRGKTLPGTLNFLEEESQIFLNHLHPNERKSVCLRLSLLILSLDRIAYLASAESSKLVRSDIYDEVAYLLYCSIYPNSRPTIPTP